MTFARKLLLVICCGTVCATIASIALYFRIKNSGEEERETTKKKKRYELDGVITGSRVIKTRYETRRLKVPKLAVRAIIGHRGRVIRDIEAKTNTRLHFDDDYVSVFNEAVEAKRDSNDSVSDDWCDDNNRYANSSDHPNDDYVALQLNQFRYVSISGSHTNIVCAENIINGMIDSELRNCERMSIPIGCDIIGICGQTIKNIQNKSGATIKVFGHIGSVRTAMLMGSDSQRMIAKQLIEERFI